MTPIVAARLRCIGIRLYCVALAAAGIVAIAVMVVGKLLVAFGDLWHGEAKAAEDRLVAAQARLLELEAKR